MAFRRLKRWLKGGKKAEPRHPTVADVPSPSSARLEALAAENKTLAARIEDLEACLGQTASLIELQKILPPIPPKHLQVRVAGKYYGTFFHHGSAMFRDMEKFLQEAGQSFHRFGNILDFGCGCGRFLIPMSLQMPPEKISGTDIDPEPIAWLKQHYPGFKDLAVNPTMPPTKYPADEFEFVYSVSIFTHLPEEMQQAWLRELARIIKPGGYGLFTTHGENYFQHLPPAGVEEMRSKGFFYLVGQATAGLPEFYQTAFHSPEYIRREWSRYFEVLAIRPKGLGNAQDMVLVRKRA